MNNINEHFIYFEIKTKVKCLIILYSINHLNCLDHLFCIPHLLILDRRLLQVQIPTKIPPQRKSKRFRNQSKNIDDAQVPSPKNLHLIPRFDSHCVT